MNAVLKPQNIINNDYHVADLKLADWGNKEIKIAETEMPGLMAIREEFAATRPAFRWRQLLALARVTASEYGRPAPGMAEAREMLYHFALSSGGMSQAVTFA